MRVEWTSYSSPIGALTVVECESGPLVIEYPNRAVSIKWAVRLRAAVPELHFAQGSCRITTTWLDEDIARATRLHPRQIGWLAAANHLAILIPCHRVVGKDGTLVGYGGGLARKRWLLDHELRSAGVVLK